MLLGDRREITTRSLLESTRELSGVFKDSGRLISDAAEPKSRCHELSSSGCSGGRTPRWGKPSPTTWSQSQPKAASLPTHPPAPPWVHAASPGGIAGSFGWVWNFPQTTARSPQRISLSLYLFHCSQPVETSERLCSASSGMPPLCDKALSDLPDVRVTGRKDEGGEKPGPAEPRRQRCCQLPQPTGPIASPCPAAMPQSHPAVSPATSLAAASPVGSAAPGRLQLHVLAHLRTRFSVVLWG